MRLLTCHIAGFGKITDFDFDFSEGLNTILEENGWGKTTFSVFLKAMFYGMEYSPRKKELLERNHYEPWDGGIYGGSVTFQVGETIYRIERTFGKSDKDDTFALYNDVTGLPSTDYTENIGAELFEMDKDSFEKSIYIPQSLLATSMTDSINAKMGNISSAKADVNNFENAVKRLDEARKEYTRNSAKNPGRLARVRNEIREIKEQMDQLPALNDAFNKQTELISDRRSQLQELTNRKEELAEQITTQSKKEQELGAYKEQKQRLSETQESIGALDDFFAAGMPTSEEFEEIKSMDRQLEVERKELADRIATLPEEAETSLLKDLFTDREPNESDISEWETMANRLQELRVQSEHAKMSEEDRNQLQELKYYFSKKRPNPEEIKLASEQAVQLATLDGQVRELEERYHKIDVERQQKSYSNQEKTKGSSLLLMIMALVLFVGGGSFLLFTSGILSLVFSIACFAVGAILLIAAIIGHVSHKAATNADQENLNQRLKEAEDKLEEAVRQRTEADRIVRDFLGDFLVSPNDSLQQMISEVQRKSDLYERLLAEEARIMEASSDTLEELSALQVRIYTTLHPYEVVYGYDLYHDNKELELIQRLNKDLDVYHRYLKNAALVMELEEKVNHAQNTLDNFIDRFNLENQNVSSMQECINLIETNLVQYVNKAEELEKLQAAVKAFEDAHEIDEETVSVEELQNKQLEMDTELAELNQFIATERDNLSNLSDQIAAIEDLSERLDGLYELEESYKQKAQRLENTLNYLQQAKESLLSRYMKPLQAGLHKYFGILYKNSNVMLNPDDFSLDMDLGIQYNYQGSTKEKNYLSAGYQDLISLCARLALIDILYRKERPILILDDPFTNMDQDKIANAMGLLHDLAEERQIIYFTCHESRLP